MSGFKKTIFWTILLVAGFTQGWKKDCEREASLFNHHGNELIFRLVPKLTLLEFITLKSRLLKRRLQITADIPHLLSRLL